MNHKDSWEDFTESHKLVLSGGRIYDTGLDMRSMPLPDSEKYCPVCGNVLPLDNLCEHSDAEEPE